MNPQDSNLMALIQSIARDDIAETRKLISSSRVLSNSSLAAGATHQKSTEFYFEKIRHYLVAGGYSIACSSCRLSG